MAVSLAWQRCVRSCIAVILLQLSVLLIGSHALENSYKYMFFCLSRFYEWTKSTCQENDLSSLERSVRR